MLSALNIIWFCNSNTTVLVPSARTFITLQVAGSLNNTSLTHHLREFYETGSCYILTPCMKWSSATKSLLKELNKHGLVIFFIICMVVPQATNNSFSTVYIQCHHYWLEMLWIQTTDSISHHLLTTCLDRSRLGWVTISWPAFMTLSSELGNLKILMLACIVWCPWNSLRVTLNSANVISFSILTFTAHKRC